MSENDESNVHPEARRLLDAELAKLASTIKSEAEKLALARGDSSISERDISQALDQLQLAQDEANRASFSLVKSSRAASIAALVGAILSLGSALAQIVFVDLDFGIPVSIIGILVASASAIVISMWFRVRRASKEIQNGGAGIKTNSNLQAEFLYRWVAIERAVRKSVQREIGEEAGKGPLSSIYSKFFDIADASPEDRDLFRSLLHMRNQVVHGQDAVSLAELSIAITLADGLMRRMAIAD